MNVVFSELVVKQLEQIYNYLQVKSNNAAVIIHNHILDEIERLRDFPQIAPLFDCRQNPQKQKETFQQ